MLLENYEILIFKHLGILRSVSDILTILFCPLQWKMHLSIHQWKSLNTFVVLWSLSEVDDKE